MPECDSHIFACDAGFMIFGDVWIPPPPFTMKSTVPARLATNLAIHLSNLATYFTALLYIITNLHILATQLFIK